MNETRSWIEAIREHPSGVEARLVYADYLEERGDRRGELIRLQCELPGLAPLDARRTAVEERIEALLTAHAETWLTPLRTLGAEGISARCFSGGLIERIRIDAATFAAQALALCDVEPALSTIELKQTSGVAKQLAEAEIPPQIRRLELTAARLSADELGQLLAAPWFTRLESLSAKFNQWDDACLQLLADVTWPNLTRLDLSVNRGGAAGLARLAARPVFPRLTSLSINMNPMGDGGITALAESPHFPALVELEASRCEVGRRGAAAIARSARLANLESLALRSNPLGVEGAAALASSAYLKHVRRLDLRDMQLDKRIDPRQSIDKDALRERFGAALLI